MVTAVNSTTSYNNSYTLTRYIFFFISYVHHSHVVSHHHIDVFLLDGLVHIDGLLFLGNLLGIVAAEIVCEAGSCRCRVMLEKIQKMFILIQIY